MARQYAVDDSKWVEVMEINSYAMFMGSLMMGVRGLGLLIITWTTAVLLGGFASDLGKKDFWCLTGITLVQTAGAFNFLLKEAINDTVHSWWGLYVTVIATFNKKYGGFGIKKLIISFVLVAIYVLVFGVILCALGVVYMLGIYISAGVSLWRLIEHDFGDAGGANQRPALQVLYILAVAQGVLFGYKTICALVTGSRLANEVVKFIRNVDKELIEVYIEDTVAGCEKNLSFASGRNFVTYGVDLMMEAKSREDFIAGIKLLGAAIDDEPGPKEPAKYLGCAIKYQYPPDQKVPAKYLLTRSDSSSAIIQRQLETVGPRKVLAKYLLTRSDSSSAIIQRLQETVGPRSPYSRKIKEHVVEHVVRILDIIGPCIRLEQFPRAIECLCSVVDTSDDDHEVNDSEEYENVGRQHGIICSDFFSALWLRLRCKWQLNGSLRCKWQLDRSDRGNRKKWKMREKEILDGDNRKEVEIEREENIRRGLDRRLIKATNIIHKLVADEDNRWILRTCVSNTVLHKIAMLPLKLHRENHYLCRGSEKSDLKMLEQCWVLTEWLLVVLTETSRSPLLPAAATPVGEVVEEGQEQLLLLQSMDGCALGSTIKRTIKDSIESTMKCVFDCLDCSATQKRQAIQILLHLPLDISFIIKEDSESSKRRLSWVLLLILCSTDDDSKYWMVPSLTYRNNNCFDFDGIRRLAGEKLSEMLRENHGLASEETATEEQLVGLALGDLKSAFYDCTEDISVRTLAIIIMENLYHVSYTPYSEVEGFLVDAIPEVIKETLIRCGSITAEWQEQATDVEKGNNVSQDNQDGCKDSERLQKVLLSVCHSGFESPIWNDKFVGTASEICEEQVKSYEDFIRLVRQSDRQIITQEVTLERPFSCEPAMDFSELH